MILKIDPAEPIDLPVVCGLFADCESADLAWDVGATRGYGPAEVSIVVSDGTRKRPAVASAGGGSGVCGMIDSTVSGLTSVLGAIGTSFLVPDVGLVVAGPLAREVSRAQEGRAREALLDGIRRLGVRPDRLAAVQERVERGGIVLILKPRNRQDREAVAADWRTRALDVIA